MPGTHVTTTVTIIYRRSPAGYACNYDCNYGRRHAAHKKVEEQYLGAPRDTISRTNDVFAGFPNNTRTALKCMIETPILFLPPDLRPYSKFVAS